VQTVNWNSMDVWVWYSRFEDCGRGVHNVMGNWHAWHNLFLHSRVADLSMHNLMAFSAVGNTSVGSKCFFDFSSGHTWGSPASVTGNRVLDPTGEWAVILDNAGPYLLVDNVFRLSGKGRGVRLTWGDQTLAGNTYTKRNAVKERGRFRRLGERVVENQDIPDAIPALRPTPPRWARTVFEVPAGSGAEAIQRAIDQAARLAGRRPVVHLPMGSYPVARTLVPSLAGLPGARGMRSWNLRCSHRASSTSTASTGCTRVPPAAHAWRTNWEGWRPHRGRKPGRGRRHSRTG
jgi:hypothetical protein